MLTVRKLLDQDLPKVSGLAVSDAQLPFVGTIDEILSEAQDDWHFHVMDVNGDIVGFFNIDVAYGTRYDFAGPQELGLRAFFVDQRHQGKGYGKAAIQALKPYLQENYSAYASIVLTVNCKNPGAFHIYQTAGFSDTGELYHGGSAGPQHIMRMDFLSN